MNCYVHPDREAVGTCVECGRPICEGCATEVGGKLHCKGCVSQKVENALNVSKQTSANNDKWLGALLLNIFFGTVGAHRFYVGKIGTGILMLLTLGGFGIWTLVDLILIITGKFTDKDGKVIARG